jgi:hypothetical protein
MRSESNRSDLLEAAVELNRGAADANIKRQRSGLDMQKT